MLPDITITAIASSVVFIYNILIFEFSARILDGATKNPLFYIGFSVINTILLLLFNYLNIPHYLVYVLICLTLCFEFKLFSKAPFRQALFGASVFTFHVSTMHVLFIFIYSHLFETPPLAIFDDVALFQRNIIVLCVVLAVLLIIVRKVIPLKDLQRVSNVKTYTFIMIGYAILSILFSTLQSAFFITHSFYPEQFYIVISTFFMSLLLFYYVFLYTINFVNMHMYKRQSDEVESIYRETLNLKKEITEKIKRDGLTGLYNKTYIFDLLDELYADRDKDFGLLFVDINKLKFINDNYGHEAGDELIISVANSISRAVRDEDIVARVGGDEIIIILTDTTSTEIDTISDRISAIVREDGSAKKFPVSAGIGGVYVSSEMRENSLREILDEADRRMRKNKDSFYAEEGRN